MPTGITLADLRSELRSELGHSQTANTGTSAEAMLNYMLRRSQQQLWQEYDWPSKCGHAHVSPKVGCNFYSIPAGFNADGIEKVYLRDGKNLTPLVWGIPIRDRMDSDYDLVPVLDQSWPPTHWGIWTYAPPLPAQIFYDGSSQSSPSDGIPFAYGTQLIEIFPVPLFTGVQTNNLVIIGQRSLPAMTADAHRCVLDSTAIVLRAAAELSAKAGAKDAQVKMQAANNYTRRVLFNASKDAKMFILGGGADPNESPRAAYGPDFDFLRK